MERVGDILARLTPTSTSRAATDTSPDASEAVCPLCNGAGFVRADVPVGHPDFGRAIPCQCAQKSVAIERRDRLLRYSNLGPLARYTFDTLIPQGRSADAANQERFRRVVAACRDFAQAPQGWLALLGPSGCGKTHLAAAIANDRIARGEPVLFSVVPDLLDHLRATFGPQSELTYDELFESVREAPCLVLDDIGAHASTAWASEKLFQLINHRFNAQLPTVFTSNRPLEDIEDRLRTRLSDPVMARVFVVEEPTPPLFQTLGGIGEDVLRSMTFEGFDPRGVHLSGEERRNLEQSYRLARSFADSPEGWLVFHGGPGCGKTHLAVAIANYRLRNGQPVFFAVVADLLDHLRSSFSPESHRAYDQVFDAIRRAPLLILDDFGRHRSSPWAEEKLYQLTNYRYTSRLPTVFTTTLSLEEIEEMHRGIGSRMADQRLCTSFQIMAPDYRGDVKPPPRSQPRGRRSRG